MSLILDALNRSREDENPVPGLGTHHPVDPNPAASRQYLVWVVLAVALVVIGWLLMERFTGPPVPGGADIGAPVAELSSNIGSAVTSVTAELKARAAASAPQAVAQPAPDVTESQAEITQPLAAAVTPAVQIPEPAAATPPAPNPPQDSANAAAQTIQTTSLPAAESAAVAELYQNRELQKDPVMPEPAARSSSRSAQSVDIDQILQQAREEVENASLDEHPVPFLADLSQQIKDDIPTLYYQRHDYSSDTNTSSIVLNGAPYKAGESPLPGMKVEEILTDSVVLNYRGTQFRLRALNSWVNL